jgi:FolB domain-containing protein
VNQIIGEFIMNRIYIRDLVVNCIIGTEPKERVEKQDVCINITMECDFIDACESDCLDDTMDYKALKDELVAFLEISEFLLIEKMAGEIAKRCLAQDLVLSVVVSVDKPGALTRARSVAVEIERKR